ncbi:hypothetical protein Rsub_10684 [Raphidocelis subcapitata]|uniref:Uncharacterized protein n=1 Tax=Raphidocelis subcapitata TaxID=307507 RepID=A0A2V0PEB0_9CHLO|nr:hypothetical protein Rsub_10684 [Raphidocelis subcapitata]|eukprot:GBF98184.1 hypothetical protein Rsub_10684 [Raphidocelis subcapitata]
MGPVSKVTPKSFYDLGKKELKTRVEAKLTDSDLKFGFNVSDVQRLVGLDLDHGPYKLGYDVKRKDLAFQWTHKGEGSTLKVRQVVPGLKWEVVPTPVVELSTKLLDSDKWKDSLKLTFDFMNRNAYYAETLKFNKQYKVRIAGDSQSSNHAFCLGWKPDHKWAKSFKLLHTPAAGPLFSYKVKPAPGWKIANEASPKIRTIYSSISYKALNGDAEFIMDVALPWDKLGSLPSVRLVKRAGVKVDFKF